MKSLSLISTLLVLAGCATTSTTQPWHLVFHHDAQGTKLGGSREHLVNAVRSGCQIRVAWGAKRRSDPSRTIEHAAMPIWLAVRDSVNVEAQLSDVLINLRVLGEPLADFPQTEPYGGTDKAVSWRANLSTDGTFNAVWYDVSTGALVVRRPQKFAMRWFADCQPGAATPLF